MPRLTTHDYLDIHHKLRRLWLHDERFFAELTPSEQWSLHDFFATDYDWSDENLIARRKYVSKIEPSLPQKAGRALEKFWGTTATRSLKQVQAAKTPAVPGKRRQQGDRKLTVKAVARPQPDAKLLAKAFIGLARAQAKEKGVELPSYRPPGADGDNRPREDPAASR